MRKEIRESVNRRPQVGLTGAGKFGEKAEQAENLFPTPSEGQRRVQTLRKRRATDAIEIFQPDIAERGGDFFRIVDLRRCSLGHRPARVDQKINIHFLLGGEYFQQQPLEASVNIPVYVAQVVAVLIAPVVGKFQTEPLARSRMLASGSCPTQSLGDQMETFELAEKLSVEEGFGCQGSSVERRVLIVACRQDNLLSLPVAIFVSPSEARNLSPGTTKNT